MQSKKQDILQKKVLMNKCEANMIVQLALLKRNMGLGLIKLENCKNVLGPQKKKRGKPSFFFIFLCKFAFYKKFWYNKREKPYKIAIKYKFS